MTTLEIKEGNLDMWGESLVNGQFGTKFSPHMQLRNRMKV